MSLYLENVRNFAIVLAPIVGLILLRHRLGRLNAAAALVAYRALFPLGEHAGWTFYYVFGDRRPRRGVDASCSRPRTHGGCLCRDRVSAACCGRDQNCCEEAAGWPGGCFYTHSSPAAPSR